MKKILVISFLTIALILSASFWMIVSKGYDRQNEIILSIKKILNPNIARKIRDTIFFIPNLQQRNKF